MNNTFVFLTARTGLICLWLLWAAPLWANDPASAPEGGGIFLENRNQWDPQARYRAHIPGGNLFLTPQRLMYVFYDPEVFTHPHTHGSDNQSVSQQALRQRMGRAKAKKENAFALGVRFEGASSQPEMRSVGQGTERYNFFVGNDPSRWASDVRAFAQVRYEQLYPGINLSFQRQQDQLKYEFEVMPGARPAQIRMVYEGVTARDLSLQDGHLIVRTPYQQITEQKPYCYQLVSGQEVEVPSRFRLNGVEVTFEFPEGYDTTLPLVIDPILIFSTYSASTLDNWGFASTYDSQGNMITGGIVLPSGGGSFPITTGAFDATFNGVNDVVLHKYSPDGRRLIAGTYLGGISSEVPQSIVTNARDEIIVMGATGSPNFPTTVGAANRIFRGGPAIEPISGLPFNLGADVFVAVFNPTMTTLLGSTFIGGTDNDGINTPNNISPPQPKVLNRNYGDEFRGDVITDAAGNIYIASTTFSNNLPATPGALRTTFAGVQDAWVARLNPYVNGVQWLTYLGGNSNDAAYSIKLDPTGNVVVAGGTSSTNFPTTAGALRTGFQGVIDGFVSKLTPSGNALVASTFLGTEQYDQAYICDLDRDGNIGVFGVTYGNWPMTPGIYRNLNGRQFIVMLRPGLDGLVFSTTIGSGTLSSAPNLSPTAFLINDCGNIYLSGWGGGVNEAQGHAGGNVFGMPTTTDAFQRSTDGSDFYIMILSRGAQNLLYATYIGGNGMQEHVDGGTSRFSKEGVIYHAVCACRANTFPSTPGVFGPNNLSSNCNMASFKFDLEVFAARFSARTVQGSTDLRGCAPLDVVFRNTSQGGTSFRWSFGDGTSRTTSAGEFTYRYNTPGTYIVSLEIDDPIRCDRRSIVYDTVVVFPPTNFSVGPDVAICRGTSVQLTATGGTVYRWSPATGLSNPNIANPVANPQNTTRYTVELTNASGCRETRQVNVTVNPAVAASFQVVQTLTCDTIPTVEIINNSTGLSTYTFRLSTGEAITSNQNRFRLPISRAGIYTVSLVVDNGTCRDSLGNRFEVLRNQEALFPNASVSRQVVQCAGETALLRATGGVRYLWLPATGLNDPTSATPVVSAERSTTYTVRIFNRQDCFVDSLVRVEVLPRVVANFTTRLPDLCQPIPALEITNQSTGLAEYTFDMGDGNKVTTRETTFTYQYAQAGRYRVRLDIVPTACATDGAREVEIPFIADALFHQQVRVSPSQTICQGQAVQLSATGGARYQWSPVFGLNNTNIGNPVASPNQTTNYRVRIFNNSGCFVDSTVTVTVIPNIRASFNLITTDRCEPLPLVEIQNFSTGQQQYTFRISDGRSITTSANRFVVPFERGGEYRISLVVGVAGCIDSLSRTIQLSFDSTALFRDARVSPPQLTCVGTPVRLFAAGGTRYQWTPAIGLDNPSSPTPLAAPPTDTEYTVRIFNARGCFVDSVVRVRVLPAVRADFEVVTEDRCNQPTRVLIRNRSAGLSAYTFDFGNGQTLTTAEPEFEAPLTVPGTYTIRLRVANDACAEERTQTATVRFEDLTAFFANARINTAPQTVCAGQVVPLSASGGSRYEWSPAAGLDRFDIATPQATVLTTTTFSVRIFHSSGCFVDRAVRIGVDQLVSARLEVQLLEVCDTVPLLRMLNRSEGGGVATLRVAGQSLSVGTAPVELKLPSGRYTLELQVVNGVCQDMFTQTVEVPFDPTALFTENVRVSPAIVACQGDRIPLTASGGVRYQWSPATGLSDPTSPNPTVNVQSNQTYTVRVFNEKGCFTEREVPLRVVPPIQLTASYETEAECGQIPLVTFRHNSTGADGYVLFTGDGRELPLASPEIAYQYSRSGVFTAILRGENEGCYQEERLEIIAEQVVVANAFTPNGDGKNDTFEIQSVRTGWKVEIFNRWGQKVFESNDYRNDWRGFGQGNQVFYYHLTAPDGYTCKGYVTQLQ